MSKKIVTLIKLIFKFKFPGSRINRETSRKATNYLELSLVF